MFFYKPARDLARQKILNVFYKPVGNLARQEILNVLEIFRYKPARDSTRQESWYFLGIFRFRNRVTTIFLQENSFHYYCAQNKDIHFWRMRQKWISLFYINKFRSLKMSFWRTQKTHHHKNEMARCSDAKVKVPYFESSLYHCGL